MTKATRVETEIGKIMYKKVIEFLRNKGLLDELLTAISICHEIDLADTKEFLEDAIEEGLNPLKDGDLFYFKDYNTNWDSVSFEFNQGLQHANKNIEIRDYTNLGYGSYITPHDYSKYPIGYFLDFLGYTYIISNQQGFNNKSIIAYRLTKIGNPHKKFKLTISKEKLRGFFTIELN